MSINPTTMITTLRLQLCAVATITVMWLSIVCDRGAKYDPPVRRTRLLRPPTMAVCGSRNHSVTADGYVSKYAADCDTAYSLHNVEWVVEVFHPEAEPLDLSVSLEESCTHTPSGALSWGVVRGGQGKRVQCSPSGRGRKKMSVCGGSIAPIDGYKIHDANSCDEAYAMDVEWVVEIFGNEVGVIDVSHHLVDGYCGKGVGEEWGIVAGGTQTRVECLGLPKLRTPPPTKERPTTNSQHVLWSRGWEDMVECSTVPRSYYAAGTEHRHTADQMNAYFQNCGGLLWIRLNTGPTCDTQTFFEHVLPHMTKPFTLVTTDGDNSVPSRIAGAQKMLDHPLLERWLTQNYDGTIKHPKLHPFPIGFDLHTARPGKVGRVKGFPPLQAARTTQHVRENKVLFDGMSVNRHRSHADQGLACVDHHHKRRMPVDAVWDEYRSYTFGASPHGGGLDCHRTWEMLYLGMVPIVESSSLDPLYEGLPVVIVKDWQHLCERNMTELYDSVRTKLPVKEEVFTLEWWLGQPKAQMGRDTITKVSASPGQHRKARSVGGMPSGERDFTHTPSEKGTIKDRTFFAPPDRLNKITLPLERTACPTSTRVGDRGDGGWWLCTPKRPKSWCVVYSFGIKDNFSFDQAMVKRGCEVHGFDPSPDGLASKRAYEGVGAVYHDFGVGDVDKTYGPGTVPFHWPGIGYLRDSNTRPWTLRRIPTIQTTLGKDKDPTILKLDVEGTEWSVLEDIVASTSWEQFMVEFHFPPQQYTVSQGKNGGLTIVRTIEKAPDRIGMLRKLSEVATMWKWEFNQHDPQCVEAYFVRRKDKDPGVVERAPRWMDAIHVNAETDVLLMRFAEYDDFVDEFHVFESNVTQQGTMKPLYFAQNRAYFGDYADKIRYHTIPRIPENERRLCFESKNWACEKHDRQYVGKVMNELLRDEDVLVFSDADEIVDATTMQQLKDGTIKLPARINPPIYKYSLHWKQTDKSGLGVTIGSGQWFKTFDDYNHVRYPRKQKVQHTIKKGGWHLSTCCTMEQIRSKVSSIIEGHGRLHSDAEMERRVRNGISLWDANTRFTYQPDPPSPLPRLATSDPKAFQNLMLWGQHDQKPQPRPVLLGAGIPTVIMQTMLGPGSDKQAVPDWVRQKWTTLNPQITYKFFNDADARAFLASHYSAAHLDLFDQLKENKYKADLFRYCYLYQYGGIYADVDTEPLLSMHTVIDTHTSLFTVWNGNGRHICNGFIAVTPKHPIMKRAIEQMLKVGTSFETIGAPFQTHPTNQLYEIVNDILPSHTVHQGFFDTDVGGIQLAIERCPSYGGCFVEYNATKVANTRYKEWTGQGFRPNY